ncbi:MAG: diiron oxygenase [Planctomycetota bacterium]|jgi:hypothetical protein
MYTRSPEVHTDAGLPVGRLTSGAGRSVKLLSPRAIGQHRDDPVHRTGQLTLEPVDASLPFVPEAFTQLPFTPLYVTLSRAQRLRYNQLFAIRVTEQVMVFEELFTARMLARLVGHRRVPAELSDCIADMVSEEHFHAELFRELCRACLPDVYARSDSYFTRMGPVDRWLFGLFTSAPYRLPFLLWFTIALEEYSLGLSRACMAPDAGGELGPLEPNFVRLHREHSKDEVRHIHIGAHLLRLCFGRGSTLKRRLNARLFAFFVRNIVIPKRSGAAVVHRLVDEFPELEPRRNELLAGLRALKDNEAFQKSLFNRSLMPLTFALLDEQPEFRSLGRVMRGYDRREAGAA